MEEFFGKIPIDPIAKLSEHHVSDNGNGYATLEGVLPVVGSTLSIPSFLTSSHG